ncbi:unnamed protein product [Zymoseptoria tritici ST99CH_1A5]|uniref:Ubiquitin ligase complex F-box protein n=4 Tax=Zymoseptoria tritici TaxID=1047171 RepID=F9XBY1_ZYMTI|nr:ubiquitin ligase complex F-box protein [Zymoseptoria tritici IPO323]SMQ50769.1 unnamed protein product [Zymoseptoria tritici ST99CH_3D7]SMR52684.1 unnamed protein product [Zymoseptoria tritici ST99CH_1E4]SMR53918.1 unnamed protein product [Zymoseptoria tritici ST99CH_3D1]SMY24436.1 unnamed protein product [Zymoseptoria tritici ST99CH_1A5]EGP87640.1 ubiquitin ligase complex F-box protein [Zymoseptoria tritici IPO323]
MSRSRNLLRRSSSSSSSSSSTSPERGPDDDNDSFMIQANDSQSSLGADMSADLSYDAAMRREYEERCRVSPVHRLPAELLISIFSRLTSTRDLQNCLLVSKEWARNSVGLLWHRPAMSKWDSIHSVMQSIRQSNKFFAYQDLVKRLNMSTLAGQVSDGTLMGMSECKRIERLTLTNCCKLTDLSLQPLVDGNRSLLALDVTGLDQLTDKTMMAVADNCLRLQGLNVTGCKKLTDASIVAIARNCRHLKRLKFNNCAQLTDASIMTVAAHSTHLLEIDLYGLQNLESPSVAALLSSCGHLREMRLAHCSRITDAAFLDIPSNPEGRRSFDALRILDLTDCSELGDKGVEKIVQSCPRLRNLILAKCRQITDRAVMAITKLGKNLHYIHLGHCARITDLSVEALAKSCNRIRYIDLACCSSLTDHSVMKLAGLPKLKRIGLVKCAGITDRSIYSLAIGEVKNGRKVNGVNVLERVHLSYCTLLTLDGIHVLLNNCPKLTHLSLTGVQAFLRDELLAFCREAPPEFNEHQRDVFCVFSGNGVARLRDFLNEQKHHAANSGSVTSSVVDDSDMIDADMDDQNPDSDGSNTPVVNVDVHGNGQYPPGGTPVIPGPSSNIPFPPVPPMHHGADDHGLGFSTLSQSAPATTGGIMWADDNPLIVHSNPAHHVTGMLGATILDEGDGDMDDTFGEGSDTMGD